MQSAVETVEVAVIGAGPAGMAAALALCSLGSEVTLLAPPFDPVRNTADTRTTALLESSIALMENLGVWPLCRSAAAPLAGIRIVDDREGLLRAPEVLFRACELGIASFGANIANPALNAALDATATRCPHLRRVHTVGVTTVAPAESSVRLNLTEGKSLDARLVVAADGRNSIARAGAGIDVRTSTYPQAAVAASFRHTRPHDGTTVELHRRTGPLTTVPLPGDASSLVWVEAPTEAHRIAALDDAAFVDLLEQRLQSLLGSIHTPGRRVAFPLSTLSALCMGQRRVALVGEAAHVIPPIGAQGLNLGLRDASVLAECVADARERGLDVGCADVLAAYDRARQADVMSRAVAVDALNRSLLTDFLPVQALRGAGLHLLANLPALRRLIMQGGMSPPGPLPRLMQPGALA